MTQPETCLLRTGRCLCGCGGSVVPCPSKVKRVIKGRVDFQGPVAAGSSMVRSLGWITLNGGTVVVQKTTYCTAAGNYVEDPLWVKSKGWYPNFF